MKSLPLLFLGIFFTLSLSWSVIVLTNHLQLGNLQPSSQQFVNPETGEPIPGVRYKDAKDQLALGVSNQEDTQYPRIPSGIAQQGKAIYEELGCLYCHSQQVRRKGFGSDFERGWGDRQTVARDYIRQSRVLLGTMRTGPDLMSVGQRIPTTDWHYTHLYYPRLTSDGSIMPAFTFLFETKMIGPDGPAPDALKLRDPNGNPAKLADGSPLPDEYLPPEGYEVVPTERGRALVAYLLSLRLDYELPESKFSQP